MIKLFRKIRLNILSEGKSAAYLKYALGEIVLVVIGILIALQINYWNERRKTVSLAKSYLSDIKKDLVTDTLTFNAATSRIKRTIKDNKSLLDPDFTNSISVDSILSLLITSFHSTRIYHIDNATYLKLSNTGFLETGLFSDVFTHINNYYNKEYVVYSEYIEWDEDQSIDIYHSGFLGNYNIDLPTLFLVDHSATISDKARKDIIVLKEFINAPHFRNATWANYNRKGAVLERLLVQKQIATDLIKKIETNLSNK